VQSELEQRAQRLPTVQEQAESTEQQRIPTLVLQQPLPEVIQKQKVKGQEQQAQQIPQTEKKGTTRKFSPEDRHEETPAQRSRTVDSFMSARRGRSRHQQPQNRRTNVRVNLFPDLPDHQQPVEELIRPASPQEQATPERPASPQEQAGAQALPLPGPAMRKWKLPIFRGEKRRHKPTEGRISPPLKQPPLQDQHITGPLYHVPVEAPTSGSDRALINPPPRLFFPSHMPKPTNREEQREVDRQANIYHAIHTEARDRFITQATQRTPLSAMHHDSGLTWAKYHAYVFDTMNPGPRIIANHLGMNAPLPASFHPTLQQPCSLRWGIIGHNQLQPIRSVRELRLYLNQLERQ
jgi:hypothetical protein